MTQLQGRAIVVTGGAAGIGLACVEALVDAGADVVVGDIDADGVRAVCDRLGCEGVVADVSKATEAVSIVAAAERAFGRLDGLVAAAGTFDGGSIADVDPDRFAEVLAVNLTGVFLVAQAALEAMRKSGGGRIITIGSLSSQTGGLAAGAAYTASKGGVMALTKSIARHGGPLGVTANCVIPGIIDTAITQAWSDDSLERMVEATPLGRTGTPAEIAALVAFLLSDAAAFVTGAHIDANGGLYMS